jgi:hypothetical protein
MVHSILSLTLMGNVFGITTYYSLGPKIRVTETEMTLDTLCLAFATTFTTVQNILMNGKDQCIH